MTSTIQAFLNRLQRNIQSYLASLGAQDDLSRAEDAVADIGAPVVLPVPSHKGTDYTPEDQAKLDAAILEAANSMTGDFQSWACADVAIRQHPKMGAMITPDEVRRTLTRVMWPHRRSPTNTHYWICQFSWE